MIKSKKIVVIMGLLLLFLAALGVRSISTDSAKESKQIDGRDYARIENIFARPDIDQAAQDFIVQEFYGYSAETEDREELRDIVELSAVIGFLRASFQAETYKILSPEYSFQPENSVVVRQYEVALGDSEYFLSVGIDENEETQIIYLDDVRTDEETVRGLDSSDVGFEIIENLTLEAANQP